MSNTTAAAAPRTDQSIRPVLFFTLAYLMLAAIGAVVAGNSEFIFYIVVMIALILIIAAVHWRVGFTIPLLWCLSIWGLLHMAGGLVPVPPTWPIHGDTPVLYSLWLIPGYLKYDQLVHAFGFGTTTWVCWQALRAAVPGVRPGVGVMTLCATAAMGFGALNEIVEFIATLTMPQTNVGGYVNTGWDLVANAAGALIAAIAIARFSGSATTSPDEEATNQAPAT